MIRILIAVFLAFGSVAAGHVAQASPRDWKTAVYHAVRPAPKSAPCPRSDVHSVGPSAWIGDDSVRAWTIWQAPNAALDASGIGVPKRRYAQKVLWMMRKTLHQVVTLRGWNLRTGKFVWFKFADQGAGTQRVGPNVVLDPRYSNANSPGDRPDWLGFSSAILLPSTGCYVLFAQWRSGSWAIPFESI